MPAMQYFEKAQSSFKPPLVTNENAFLGDVASSYAHFFFLSLFAECHLESATKKSCADCFATRQSTSPETPISGGLYRLEKGTPLDYTYSYDEIKIILEGHFYIKGRYYGLV